MNSAKYLKYGVAVCGISALAASAACTPSGSDSNEMVWAIGGAEATEGGSYQKIVELWNEKNPDTPIRIETLPEEADLQREQHALELQAGNSTFDVLGVDVVWTGEYAQNGWIESLEDVRGDIEAASLPGPFESATWEGELWAAPYTTNGGFLYYRTDLVEEPPTTWEELCTVAEDVGGAEDIGGFIGQGAKYEGFVVNWLEYYWGAGGELYNEDQSEVVLDDAAATQATEFMTDSLDGCYAAGFNTAKEEEASNIFQEGDAVFMRNWPYVYDEIEGDPEHPLHGKVGIAPLPTFTGEGSTSGTGGFHNAVSAFSEKKDESKEFVTWASTDPEAQKLLAESRLPATMASVYDDFADDPVMSLLSTVLQDAKARPAVPSWNQVSEDMQGALHPAYNGDGDVGGAVGEVRTSLEKAIE
ncbi:MAG: ABC transporter substrate-binding protein [Stackebrandtia sp.]